jgi:protein TonB
VLRSTTFRVALSALGLSTVVHAAALLVPVGHAAQSSGQDEEVRVEPVTDPVLPSETPEPELTAKAPADVVPATPKRTHPYPVVPPNREEASHPSTPAAAAPADTTSDDTPRFTIAIGAAANDANGVVSPAGAAAPREDDAAPIPEQSVDGQARLVRGLAPTYPDGARADGVEGDVRLELVVGLSGAVESARVVRGVGHGLDDAALRAVQQFRFAPATKAGRAVRVRMGWSMQFRLR